MFDASMRPSVKILSVRFVYEANFFQVGNNLNKQVVIFEISEDCLYGITFWITWIARDSCFQFYIV